MSHEDHPETAWRVTDWAPAAGISRAAFYLLPDDCRPRLVRVGRRVLILEAPREWLERMAKRGGVPAAKAG